MTETLVQVYKLASIPEKGLSVKDFTPKDYELVNVQTQNDCLYLTFHKIKVWEFK